MEEWIYDALDKMRRNGITQKELAQHLGYSKFYMSRIMNGVKEPYGIAEKVSCAVDGIIEEKNNGQTTNDF